MHFRLQSMPAPLRIVLTQEEDQTLTGIIHSKSKNRWSMSWARKRSALVRES